MVTFMPIKPMKLSRTKLDDFMKCPRCFWLDRKKKVGRPPSFPLSLNNAVDALLKKEFDVFRERQQPHPLMVQAGVRAVPFQHPQMDEWRNSFKGLAAEVEGTGLTIHGGVDDIWSAADGTLHVVDYKATAKADNPGIDADWQEGYRRQVAIYQWLLRRNGFKVSNRAYFVYVNGIKDAAEFGNRLEFRSHIIPYDADDSWIMPALRQVAEVLASEKAPEPGKDCGYCEYRRKAAEAERA
jgi:hypothetical protein